MEVILPTGETFQIALDDPVLQTCTTFSLCMEQGDSQIQLPSNCRITARQFSEYLKLDGVYCMLVNRYRNPIPDEEDPHSELDDLYPLEFYPQNVYSQIKQLAAIAVVAMKAALLLSDEQTVDKCHSVLYYVSHYFMYVGCSTTPTYARMFPYFLVELIMNEFEDYEPILKTALAHLAPHTTIPITKDHAFRQGFLYNRPAFEVLYKNPPFVNDTLLGIDPADLVKESLRNASRRGGLNELESILVSVMDGDENMTFDQMCRFVELDNVAGLTPLGKLFKNNKYPRYTFSGLFESNATPDKPVYNNGEGWYRKCPNVAKLRFTAALVNSGSSCIDYNSAINAQFPGMAGIASDNYDWKVRVLEKMRDFFIESGRRDIAEKYYTLPS